MTAFKVDRIPIFLRHCQHVKQKQKNVNLVIMVKPPRLGLVQVDQHLWKGWVPPKSHKKFYTKSYSNLQQATTGTLLFLL
jgi:hypothetical protein